MKHTHELQANALIGHYPTVPAWYPNRAVRRAVKQRKEFRIPQVWKALFLQFPDVKTAIRKAH